jgi:hypothetical protein
VVEKDRADSILFGAIRDVKESVLIEDPDANISESSVVIYLDFKWVDRRTGRTIVEKSNIQQRAEFIQRRREDEGTAAREAFVDLAERVVNLMEEEW